MTDVPLPKSNTRDQALSVSILTEAATVHAVAPFRIPDGKVT